jgi:hypothetical protein
MQRNASPAPMVRRVALALSLLSLLSFGELAAAQDSVYVRPTQATLGGLNYPERAMDPENGDEPLTYAHGVQSTTCGEGPKTIETKWSDFPSVTGARQLYAHWRGHASGAIMWGNQTSVQLSLYYSLDGSEPSILWDQWQYTNPVFNPCSSDPAACSFKRDAPPITLPLGQQSDAVKVKALLALTIGGCKNVLDGTNVGGIIDVLDIALIVPPPQLTLFLDVDDDFDPAHPVSDDRDYVPGSRLDGTSVPVTPEGTPLQTVRVIAAYVDATGAIVPPPSGTTAATFTLSNTSSFKGFAMNAGTSTAPDFSLGPNVITFQDNVAFTTLHVFDYGGTTTVTATTSPGASGTASMMVPYDIDDNRIPDVGWWAFALGAVLHTPDIHSTGDIDNDGLATFEEYRGFIVSAEHRRTNPEAMDIFIYSNVPLASYGIGHAANLPLTVHRVRLDQVSTERIINHTLNSTDIQDYFAQHAVLVFDGGLHFLEGDEKASFGWIWCGDGASCVPSTVGEGLNAVNVLDPSRNVMILTGYIGLASDEGSDIYGEDPADAAIADTAIAHEVGHTAGIEHYSYTSGTGRLSVMVDKFGEDEPWFGSWYTLPYWYDSTDVSQIRLVL